MLYIWYVELIVSFSLASLFLSRFSLSALKMWRVCSVSGCGTVHLPAPIESIFAFNCFCMAFASSFSSVWRVAMVVWLQRSPRCSNAVEIILIIKAAKEVDRARGACQFLYILHSPYSAAASLFSIYSHLRIHTFNRCPNGILVFGKTSQNIV